MDTKKQTAKAAPVPGQPVPVDFGRMYRFSPDEMCPEVRASAYANVSYITCTNRDVFIDFLEMPGVKKDGKMMIPATRIYLSHSAAQQLAAKLSEILEGSYQRGEMEFYEPGETTVPAKAKKQKRK
jgi:hypothetical protein